MKKKYIVPRITEVVFDTVVMQNTSNRDFQIDSDSVTEEDADDARAKTYGGMLWDEDEAE